MRKHLYRAAVAFLAFVPPIPLQAQDWEVLDVAGELKWRVEQLRAAGALPVAGEVIPSRTLTLDAYEQRGFLPLWTDRAAVGSLLQAIAGVRDDGLDPEDYHLSTLAEAADGARDPESAAALDLLSTDALVRVSHDLRFGKAEPQGPASEADAPWSFGGPDAVASLVDVVASGRVRETVAALRPQHFVYEGLRGALADLRRIQSAGGWERVPPGPVLGRDSVDARVPVLRRRLMLAGDLRGEVDETNLRFDSEVEDALESFQHRHGLNEDGHLGSATVAALNVPVSRRIDQVRVNLERARWIAQELPDTFVVVNVAGAKAHLLRGDQVAFETRAIVGTGHTQTPIFTAPMLYVDLNPTWTVPPGIVGEVLGLVRRDPGYLASQGMRVLDGSGRAIDPAEIDFANYTAKSFPYVFRQDPGPANALGRIKLMFPNQYSVYLHDTPTRGLFAREERLFSHGCIRIEDPLGLAELVLGDPLRWNRETLQAAIDTRESRTIRLARPVPVFVLYWTASVDLHGDLHFYGDAYDRDAGVLAELDAGAAVGTRAGEKR
jgi:murein L,D-transpeptidase YcbB/YkuD